MAIATPNYTDFIKLTVSVATKATLLNKQTNVFYFDDKAGSLSIYIIAANGDVYTTTQTSVPPTFSSDFPYATPLSAALTF